MITVMFYLGAIGLFGLRALLLRKTSPYTRAGGAKYEKRRSRKILGELLSIPALLLLALAVLSQIFSNSAPTSNSPAINSPLTSSSPGQSQADPVSLMLGQVFQLVEQQQLDAALDKVNAVLQAAPKNPIAYALRGNIYAEKKLWIQAEKDYQTALQIDGKNAEIKFNLAEIEFKQKKFDAARPGFVALRQDSNIGDLATYKIFLCDLFGGHEDVAAKELDGFNQVGSTTSYYFANAAWSLYHQKTEDARSWLKSAADVSSPNKLKLYTASLIYLGYLPLPPPPPPPSPQL